MFAKPIQCPYAVLQLETLVNRLHKDHREWGNAYSMFSRRKAGFVGEQSMLYFLKLIDSKNLRIFHNLRICVNDIYFQIDFLIASTRLILISEIKNHSKKLIYDEKAHQLIRGEGKDQEVFEDPVLQVKTQKKLLEKWLRANHFPDIPVVPLVVMTHPNVILENKNKNTDLPKMIIRKQAFPEVFSKIQSQHLEEIIDETQLQSLVEKILQADTQETINISEKFKINLSSIIKGIFCPECHSLHMKRIYAKWRCLHCGFEDRFSHLKALKEYGMIISVRITNQSAREFLLLDSCDTVRYILSRTGWRKTGKNKTTAYMIAMEG